MWTVNESKIVKILPGTMISLQDKYLASTLRLLKVSGIVWAGSQVTKAFRISGALVGAPLANAILSKFQSLLSIESRSKAFSIISCSLLGGTFLFYFLLVTISVIRI